MDYHEKLEIIIFNYVQSFYVVLYELITYGQWPTYTFTQDASTVTVPLLNYI